VRPRDLPPVVDGIDDGTQPALREPRPCEIEEPFRELLLASHARAAERAPENRQPAQEKPRITRIDFRPATVEEGSGIIILLAGSGKCTYTIDFGDGLFGSGPVTASTIQITHIYPLGTEFPTAATVKVMDAAGRLGSDTLTVRLLCDPAGDAVHPSVDYITCDVTTTPATMTISVEVVGTIDASSQYRVNILTATKNAQLKYSGGQVTGPLNSLTVTQVGTSRLDFTFSLQEVGLRSSGAQLRWSAEAQNGVPGTPNVGFPDRMPNSGTFLFVLP